LNLLESAGKPAINEAISTLPDLYRNASLTKDELFLEYLLSVIYVESRFDRKAISPKEARGLMQMTAIAVRQAVTNCKLKPLNDLTRLHDSHTNVKYGSCFLKGLNDEMSGDWTRTLIAYNGGYAQLIKYDRGQAIASETANYVLQVERTLNTICRRGRMDSPIASTLKGND
jgi:soluble lytic murein transglycosylase-like protein